MVYSRSLQIFNKSWNDLKNSRRQEGDIKQVPRGVPKFWSEL